MAPSLLASSSWKMNLQYRFCQSAAFSGFFANWSHMSIHSSLDTSPSLLASALPCSPSQIFMTMSSTSLYFASPALYPRSLVIFWTVSSKSFLLTEPLLSVSKKALNT
ncbi:unnamed protein product [Chrysodeixis includens]|uniref:Uncharacterized protein n=1 Tax=Chrysodeixis includens TaxID=689277 RepID=A0A9P0BQZ1_CHRIL|nr:unnamed protein product [Chrysodeixis includens]